MTTKLSALQEWVDAVAHLTQPENVHWCDGSDAENDRLVAAMNESGDLLPLDAKITRIVICTVQIRPTSPGWNT